MIDYKTDIKPLEDAGLTDDDDIAITLKLSGVTTRPINRASLMDLLNKLGVLRKVTRLNQPAKWVGSALAMQAVIEASGDPASIDAFDEWFSHITNPTNVQWDTTQSQWSAPFWAMVQTFADQPTMPTRDDFYKIASLGGGFRFANVTASDVADARSRHQIQEFSASLMQRVSAAINLAADSNGATEQTVRDAVISEVNA